MDSVDVLMLVLGIPCLIWAAFAKRHKSGLAALEPDLLQSTGLDSIRWELEEEVPEEDLDQPTRPTLFMIGAILVAFPVARFFGGW
jgi:hypothetical protein